MSKRYLEMHESPRDSTYTYWSHEAVSRSSQSAHQGANEQVPREQDGVDGHELALVDLLNAGHVRPRDEDGGGDQEIGSAPLLLVGLPKAPLIDHEPVPRRTSGLANRHLSHSVLRA